MTAAAHSTATHDPATRYFYLRDHAGHPVGVVAMRREPGETVRPCDDGFVVAPAVRVAMSVCAPSDRFDRRTGIARAIGRLDSKRQSTTCSETLTRAWRYVFPVHEPNGIGWRRACATFDAQRERLLRGDTPHETTTT